jgi:hypothetical protein
MLLQLARRTATEWASQVARGVRFPHRRNCFPEIRIYETPEVFIGFPFAKRVCEFIDVFSFTPNTRQALAVMPFDDSSSVQFLYRMLACWHMTTDVCQASKHPHNGESNDP